MKSVFIIRHAKSSWEDVGISDFDRPLNDRGKKDAPDMADRLKKRKIDIDAFISSPARRARKTAEIFSKRFKKKNDDVILVEDLYHASNEVFYSVISKASEKFDSIAIFSHNPGITEFVNTLTEVIVDNVPTCGIFSVRAEVKKWSEFQQAKKEFVFFDYPKAANVN